MTTKIGLYEYSIQNNRITFQRWSDKNDIVHIINGVIILRPGKYTLEFSSTNVNNVSLCTSNEYGDFLAAVGTNTIFALDLTVKTKYAIKCDETMLTGKHYMTVTKQPEEVKLEDEYAIIEK